VLLLRGIALVFFANIAGRPGREFDYEKERQGGEFVFELRNIFVSMDKCFHLVLRNGE
jgi:hypothetical protein